MSDHPAAKALPADIQHLSHVRGDLFTWSRRYDSEPPADVRAAAVNGIAELAQLITDLRAVRRTFIDELAVFDKRDAALHDGPRVGARVTVHRDLVFFLPGVVDKTTARDSVLAVVSGKAESGPDWIVDREMPRIPTVRVTESPNEIEGVTT